MTGDDPRSNWNTLSQAERDAAYDNNRVQRKAERPGCRFAHPGYTYSEAREPVRRNHQGPKCFSIHLKITPIANHDTKTKNPTW
jgi:hypothetical protein